MSKKLCMHERLMRLIFDQEISKPIKHKWIFFSFLHISRLLGDFLCDIIDGPHCITCKNLEIYVFLILEPDVTKCVKKGGGYMVCLNIANKGCIVTFKTSK